MEISVEQIKEVYKSWNADLIDTPENFQPQLADKENIEQYSEEQANEFVRIFKKLNP